MTDKQIVESIVKEIAASFSGAESTKHWTNDTIWFDAAPYASVGVENAKKYSMKPSATCSPVMSRYWI